MTPASPHDIPGHPATSAILLTLTAVTGLVDAVSFLALGHVFTANMTGNIVFLGFAIGGAPGMSVRRSLLALVCFSIGAIIGGRMATRMAPQVSGRTVTIASILEVVLLLMAAAAAMGSGPRYEDNPLKLQAVIVATALAMGLRNAIVRKLSVPDLTTTVLTLTITGLAADSVFAGGNNPRWLRRSGATLAMLCGAAAGAFMLRQSVALPLFVSGAITAACAIAWWQLESKERRQ